MSKCSAPVTKGEGKTFSERKCGGKIVFWKSIDCYTYRVVLGVIKFNIIWTSAVPFALVEDEINHDIQIKNMHETN